MDEVEMSAKSPAIKALHIVGARPNFMKLLSVYKNLARYARVEQRIAHTGQHYSAEMSSNILKQLGLSRIHYHLSAQKNSPGIRLGKMTAGITRIIDEYQPTIVIVYGDVDSTLAGALAAQKTNTPLAHVEAGLRSFDWSMQEEANRIVVDRLSDFLFVTCEDSTENLLHEGIDAEKVFFVGNTMIDCLRWLLPKATRPAYKEKRDRFILTTLHREHTADNPNLLRHILKTLDIAAEKFAHEVIFPVHPRTAKMIRREKIRHDGVTLLPALPYLEFLWLMKHAKAVVTDSGGVQEETTFLKVPCLTLRPSTERPITITQGTNKLVTSANLLKELESVIERKGIFKERKGPRLWDGKAGQRIAKILVGSL